MIIIAHRVKYQHLRYATIEREIRHDSRARVPLPLLICLWPRPRLEVGESLVVQDRLRHDAGKGEHGRPAVSDLLELHALDLRVRLAVEELLPEAEVARRAPGPLQHLRDTDPRGHLGEGDPDEDVTQSAVLDGGTVGGRGRGRGHGLGVAGHAHAEVDGDVPEPRELAHAPVLELGLAEVVDREVVRDAQRIEADVANVPLAVHGGGEEG